MSTTERTSRRGNLPDYEIHTQGMEGVESVPMTIDEGAMVHIMDVLTRMYSDQEMAVLREYSTNAYDSHVEAGIDDPIEVYLPTHLGPFLRIVDHGVGLSADDIRYIYSKYGASTKLHSDAFNGKLGLGCKSGLAYADQFTLVGVKNGIRTMVIVSRDEEGAGHQKIADESPTDDPSGVEIIIPSRGYNNFTEKCQRLFAWWPKGSVLVNGRAPQHWTEVYASIEPLKIDENCYLVKKGQSRLIMGNVPYPVDQEQLDTDLDFGLVVFAPIDSVDIAPSREALRYTTITKKYLKEAMESVRASLATIIQQNMDAQPTPHDAVELFNLWVKRVPKDAVDGLTYRGQYFPLEGWRYTYQETETEYVPPPGFQTTATATTPIMGTVFPTNTPITITSATIQLATRKITKPLPWAPIRADRYGKKRDSKVLAKLGIDEIPKAIVITDYDLKSYSITARQKTEQYLDGRTADYHRHGRDCFFIFTPEDKNEFEAAQWIDPLYIFSWADIKLVKLERYSRGKAVPLSYPGYVNGEWYNEVGTNTIQAAVEVGLPIFYGGMWTRPQGHRHRWDTPPSESLTYNYDLLQAVYPEHVAIALAENRKEKFLREFPQAINVTDARQDIVATWWDSLSSVEQSHVLYKQELDETPRHACLSLTRVDDPELRRAIYLAKHPFVGSEHYKELMARAGILRRMAQDQWSREITPKAAHLRDPLDRYPLINGSLPSNMEHVYLYVNTAYNQLYAKEQS